MQLQAVVLIRQKDLYMHAQKVCMQVHAVRQNELCMHTLYKVRRMLLDSCLLSLGAAICLLGWLTIQIGVGGWRVVR